MDHQDLEHHAQRWLTASPLNCVKLEKSGREIRLFDEPVFGCARADDPLFDSFRQPQVIGPHFLPPREWLAEGKTVISFFLPFSEAVRSSNRGQPSMPGEGWLYGRIEGQQLVKALCEAIAQWLREAGFAAVIPSSSERFWTVSEPDESGLSFTSNWSERHVAYACGLGTFGLSKGLITERGMAGRFGSLVTACPLPSTPRAYTQVYENCIRCGKCADRCPGGAISLEGGKDHSLCLAYQRTFLHQVQPRFGCGLCQTDVPCECSNPRRA